jgi:hypothetical protein
MDPFATERRVFEARLPELLAHHEGQYAVIFRDELIGVAAALDDAMRLAWERTRSLRVFVERIRTGRDVAMIPAYVATG